MVPVNVSTGVGPPETVSIFNRAGVGYPAKPVLTLLTLMPDVTAEN